MNAVWMVRGRQLMSRMRFWTAIVGYDPRDSSLSHRIYLVYVILFFSLWSFAVLAFFADFGAWLLSLFAVPPVQAAVTITAFLLVAGFVRQSYLSSRSSPFIFTEEDAHLICQSPADRRQVAMAWMLGDWFPGLLPYLALGVVLSFANIQLQQQGELRWDQLPTYWLAGVRMVSLLVPLHLALTALAYSLGAIRLRGNRDYPWLWLIPLGFTPLLASLLVLSKDGLRFFFQPMLFILQGGFGGVDWLAGLLLALLKVIMALGILYITSGNLSLSRASQESRLQAVYSQVSGLGDSRIIRQMKTRQRLGAGGRPTRVSGRAGVWMLVWKDVLISLRTLTLGHIGAWAGVFAACLGWMIAPDWGTRIWAFVIWAVLVSQRCTERFRADLELWMLSRQLPFRAEDLVLAEVSLSATLAAILGWLAYAVSYGLGFASHGSIPWLLPGIVLCIAMTAMASIIHQSKTNDLLTGQVAHLGLGALLLIFLLAGLPLVAVLFVTSWLPNPWLVVMMGGFVSVGIGLGMRRVASANYRNLK